MSSADDQYEQQNDVVKGDVPAGDAKDNDYASRSGQYQIPVQKDEAPVNDPIDPATADSDETLGIVTFLPSHCLFTIVYTNLCIARDDAEAIDQSNIIGSRTRGAKAAGGYTEPGDEEGLPANDGTSSTR